MSVYDCTESSDEGIEAAATALSRGELVVLPTDTVYGIGAAAFDPEAVAALLAAKGRGRQSPPPVLVPAAATLAGLATEVPPAVHELVETFWPGPLTVICRAQPTLAWDLGETGGTVALRMPDEEITLALLTRTGPLAVSSANRHGRPAATTVLEAATALGDRVAVYLDGGTSPGGVASTIVDATGPTLTVKRAGALTLDELTAVVPGITGPDGAGSGDGTAPAPGAAPEDGPRQADAEPGDGAAGATPEDGPGRAGAEPGDGADRP